MSFSVNETETMAHVFQLEDYVVLLQLIPIQLGMASVAAGGEQIWF